MGKTKKFSSRFIHADIEKEEIQKYTKQLAYAMGQFEVYIISARDIDQTFIIENS